MPAADMAGSALTTAADPMNEGNSALFELEVPLPDTLLKARSERLVGFKARYERMHQHLRLLIDKDGLEQWSKKHYRTHVALLDALLDRYPLVVFHGDVGTGKTATAEAAANGLARSLNTEGFLLKLSTRVRGIGHVGEMSTLISDAFGEAIALAGKRRFVALIVDEGDAL